MRNFLRHRDWAGLAETIEAIDSARVTTRILYVTAQSG